MQSPRTSRSSTHHATQKNKAHISQAKSSSKPMRAIAANKITIPYNWTIMQIAIGVSVFIHLVLLSIHFEPEIRKFKDNMPVLEVMLVNTKTTAKPKVADTFAQANLDRGGNTDLDRRMKSPLPATEPNQINMVIEANLIRKSASISDENKVNENTEEIEVEKLAKLEKQAQALMIQLSSKNKVITQNTQEASPTQDKPNEEKNNKDKKVDTINQAMLEMTRLEALIAKQHEEYQKRPKRKFIGAKATEYRYALYVDKWRQKVEEIGNNNYPEAAKKLKLYGKLQLTVSIKKDGAIEKIELDRSSGHKVLDAAAKKIVEMGAPYEKFPENISKDTDILSITRTWTFTKEANLSTQTE
jgi:protein TonB